MNNKVIIDGVDVSECEAYMSLDFCRIGLVDEVFLDKYCKFNPNCYYKQLQHKITECKKLKKELKRKENYIKWLYQL